MQLKDYYTILELPPGASPDEIKKAYRRLAHQFHPDKKGDDPYAAAQFTEIKEAYETLTNPGKKNLYLQQRWYAQSMGKKISQTIVTPVSVLKQLLELNKYSNTLDIHRMDKEGLFDYLCYLLSDENIEKLNAFKENDVNKEIILSALKSGQLLSYADGISLAARLQRIIPPDGVTAARIIEFAHQIKLSDYWEKRKIWIVLLVVLILCLSIFLTATG